MLEAIKLKENEKLVGLVLPTEGKMPIEDLCSLLNIKSHETIKNLVRGKKIQHHKIGYTWVIDLADFWAKTLRNSKIDEDW